MAVPTVTDTLSGCDTQVVFGKTVWTRALYAAQTSYFERLEAAGAYQGPAGCAIGLFTFALGRDGAPWFARFLGPWIRDTCPDADAFPPIDPGTTPTDHRP